MGRSNTLDLDAVGAWKPRRVDGEIDRAAVLIPVVERSGEPGVLFIKRADHLAEHPGQMGFPGGGRERRDDDLRATALRESHEEIGLHEDEVSLAGRLDDIKTITDYAVTPFVGRIPDRSYEPDDREVAEVVTLPLSDLIDPSNYEAERRSHPRVGEVTVPYFHSDGYTVWGATARILTQFFEVSLGWTPPSTPE